MVILREHKESILAIAGVFLFLPSLLMAQFVGQPALSGDEDGNALIAAYSAFFNENTTAIISSNLLVSFGGLAIYFVIALSRGASVADNLGTAFKYFLTFLLANILSGLVIIAGFLLFIVPGLYVFGRLILVPMVIADQSDRNPVEALKKSWEITKGNGFSILLLFIIIWLVGAITIGVLQMLVGVVTGLATGGQGWPLIENLVAALAGTALQIVLIVVIAAIYQQLTGKDTAIGEVFS